MTFNAPAVRQFGLVSILVLISSTSALGYEFDTHRQLSRAAFQASGVASLLPAAYGIMPADTFRQRSSIKNVWDPRLTPEEWVARGGRDEDTPDKRVLNHFYDPYHDSPLTIVTVLGARAPDWALEDRTDFKPQRHSYRHARESFYRALTSPDSETHERELGYAFYALGHVIHLIQDMAQPQHTRSDQHMSGTSYESWLEKYVEALAVGPGGLSARLPLLTTDVPQGFPRARDLWATGTGGNGTGFGLAEFSNANFVTPGTNFTALQPFATAAGFPSPVLDLNNVSYSSSMDRCKDGSRAPEGDLSLLTFYGNTFSDPVTRVRLDNPRMTTHSLFDQLLIARGDQPMFAVNCFNIDKAIDFLLPRAVAYSAALLKYFFRGQLEIAAPARFAYGVAGFQPGNTGAFTKLRLRVRNTTPNEEAGPGTMTAVVRYRTSSTNLLETPWADISGPLFAVSRALNLDTVGRGFKEFVFDFTDSPIPTNAADLFLTVVYKGPLGLEEDAVLVGGKDLFEPDPVDSANISDYDCFGGDLFYVVDLPPYSFPDSTARDVNKDRTQDLFGPWVERTRLVKTFDLDQGFPTVSEENADFNIPQLSHAQYARFIVLQDRPVYGALALDRQAQEFSTGATTTNSAGAFALTAVFNDVVRDPGGQIIRRVLLPASYRGVPVFHMLLRYNGNTEACLAQTQFLPALTRVDGSVSAQ